MPGNAQRRVEHLPLFVRLRGSVFHERGYALDAPGDFRNVTFVVNNAKGKVVALQQAPWSRPTGEETFVQLRPYADEAKARACLNVMCSTLAGARAGRAESVATFSMALAEMLLGGLRMASMKIEDALPAAACIYGNGRILDMLNREGSLDGLKRLDSAALVSEALQGPEPIGCELV